MAPTWAGTGLFEKKTAAQLIMTALSEYEVFF